MVVPISNYTLISPVATGLTSMEENLMMGEWHSFPLLSGFGPTPPVPIVDVWN